jgi:hypothetical protein
MIEWDDDQTTAVRSLLVDGWPSLSRGDRSVIMQVLHEPESVATAVDRTPHSNFWETMLKLGWANEVQSIIPAVGSIRAFSFNGDGLQLFPSFYERFELASVVVQEEQPEIRAMLEQHFAEVVARVEHYSWADLATELPSEEICVSPNRWDYYIAATWHASWLHGKRNSILIEICGFLHDSHHKPLITKKVVIHRSKAVRIFSMIFQWA